MKLSRVSLKNGLRRGSETDRPSSKAANSEIAKALIALTQVFFNHNPDPRPEENPIAWGVTIDESNLVDRISMALNAYRRQKDRMADVMNQMKRIVAGD